MLLPYGYILKVSPASSKPSLLIIKIPKDNPNFLYCLKLAMLVKCPLFPLQSKKTFSKYALNLQKNSIPNVKKSKMRKRTTS